MANNELFSVDSLVLNVDGGAPTGDLDSFSTRGFSQLVAQATASNGLTLILQVSADGVNWSDVPASSLGVSGGSASSVTDDIAFPSARFRYSASAFSISTTIRVLGRL